MHRHFAKISEVKAGGKELNMHSPFIDDDGLKFWMNLWNGQWRDFASKQQGSFISFVAKYENVAYQQAYSRLMLQILQLGGSIEFGEEARNFSAAVNYEVNLVNSIEVFRPINIHSYKSPHQADKDAWDYLAGRKLFDEENEDSEQNVFYMGVEDTKYSGRLVIPFRKDGYVYYFQARALYDQFPKYLNPPSEDGGPKSSFVLYPFDNDADHLIICEGPTDAISLRVQGLNATCTMGCHVSYVQMDILRHFRGQIILAYDNDEAGASGVESFDKMRKKYCMSAFSLLPLPKGYNDWNDAHVAGINLRRHKNKNVSLYDDYYKILTQL